MTDLPASDAPFADFDAYTRAVAAVFAVDHARRRGWEPQLADDVYEALAYAIERYEHEHLEEVLADRPPRPPIPAVPADADEWDGAPTRVPDDVPVSGRRQVPGAFTGPTAVSEVGAAGWDEWSYAQAVGVGPFRFGMTVDEVVGAAAGIPGRTSVGDGVPRRATFSRTWRIEVRRGEPTASPLAVTAYVSRAVGLFCVAVDAVHGPRVACDGLALVGRDRAELEREAIAYAQARGVWLRYSITGYAGPDDSGIVMCEQPVGPVMRSRPLFMVTRDGANTEWDSLPPRSTRAAAIPQTDAVCRH
ncbi:hypothetical protein [Embleya scabrispora]|uniref:hypothetical protein n=1 Tax=Embleya scabrispora TaxID=159449 RepID=UPI00118017C2|nr:hypothetical protein [Embleya scabrispora]